jgi:hypothetical protein
MAGLVPAIHVLLFRRASKKDVDAHAKRGHDEPANAERQRMRSRMQKQIDDAANSGPKAMPKTLDARLENVKA